MWRRPKEPAGRGVGKQVSHPHGPASLNVDSAGAGLQPGGLSIIEEYGALADGMTPSLWFERSLLRGWELFGAAAGKPSVMVLNPGVPDERRLWKVSHLCVPAGMIISARSGGGYGLPWGRPIEWVLDDVLDGYVSRAEAARSYGVALKDGSHELDETKTYLLRAQMAADESIREEGQPC